MSPSEHRTVRQEREAYRLHQDTEVKEKVRRFREGLIKARTNADDIERLERAYEKKLRGSHG
jgi:hypothetical protein